MRISAKFLNNTNMIFSMISLLSIIWKALIEKDPQFRELFFNYDEYHKISKMSSLSILRAGLISEWIKPGSSILDVGCGEGFLMEYLLRKKNCKVYGVDVSRKAIEIVRSKGMEGEVRDIDEKGLDLSRDEKYDYILFVEVLEHLKYPHKVLVEACKHANEGVIVTLPNTGYILALTNAKRLFSKTKFYVLTLLEHKRFLYLLKTAGIKAS